MAADVVEAAWKRRHGGAEWSGMWTDIRDEWGDREDTTLNGLMAEELDDEFVRDWSRYNDDLTARSTGALPGAGTDDPTAAIGKLLAPVRDRHGPGAPEVLALAVTHAYLQGLIIWENCDDVHDSIRRFLSALVDATVDLLGLPRTSAGRYRELPFPAPADDPDGLRTVTIAAARLAQAMIPQIRAENALFCSCAVDFTRQAEEVLPLVEDVRTGLESLLQRTEPAAVSGLAAELAALLHHDAEHLVDYTRQLSEHVGPAVTGFLGVVGGLGGADATRDALEKAVATSPTSEDDCLDDDVLGTELRAHRLTCNAMLDWLSTPTSDTDPSPRPYVSIDEGEIELIFSFGLPGVDPAWLVTELIGAPGTVEPRPEPFVSRLAGVPVEWAHAQRTNSWGNWSEQTRRAMRVVECTLRDHELILETTEPRQYRNLKVALAVSSIGNCHVKVTVSTSTRTEIVRPTGATGDQDETEWMRVQRALQGRSLGEKLPSGYTWATDEYDARTGLGPHTIDQWTRRAAHEVGREQLRLVAATGVEPEPFPTVVRLARRLISDLGTEVRRRWRASGGDASIDPSGLAAADADADAADLDTGSHVIIVAERLSKVWPDGSRPPEPIQHPSEVAELFGASTLLRPQRPLPSSLEEWVRLPVPTAPEVEAANLLATIGLPEDLIYSTRDVTLMCMLGSPNWAFLSAREIVEFAASLSGVFTAWSLWLRDAVARSNDVLREKDPEGMLKRLEDEAEQISDHLREVRFVLEHVFSAQLLRTSSERHLVERLYHELGHDAYAARLRGSVESFTAQHQLITAQATTIIQERQDQARSKAARLQEDFNIVVGVVAFAGLAGVYDWVNNAAFSDGVPAWATSTEAGLLGAAVAGLVGWIVRRRSSADPVVEDQARPRPPSPPTGPPASQETAHAPRRSRRRLTKPRPRRQRLRDDPATVVQPRRVA